MIPSLGAENIPTIFGPQAPMVTPAPNPEPPEGTTPMAILDRITPWTTGAMLITAIAAAATGLTHSPLFPAATLMLGIAIGFTLTDKKARA